MLGYLNDGDDEEALKAQLSEVAWADIKKMNGRNRRGLNGFGEDGGWYTGSVVFRYNSANQPEPAKNSLKSALNTWSNNNIDISATLGNDDSGCPSFAPQCENADDDINTIGKKRSRTPSRNRPLWTKSGTAAEQNGIRLASLFLLSNQVG